MKCPTLVMRGSFFILKMKRSGATGFFCELQRVGVHYHRAELVHLERLAAQAHTGLLVEHRSAVRLVSMAIATGMVIISEQIIASEEITKSRSVWSNDGLACIAQDAA